jgi:hypothetical protein
MTESKPYGEAESSASAPDPRRDRRWLLRGLGAAAAGFTAAKVVQPNTANADDGRDFQLGEDNTATRTTRLSVQDGDPIGLEVRFTGPPDGGLFGSGIAILGRGLGIVGPGVLGEGSTGVEGAGSVVGVSGHSDFGIGVRGSVFRDGPLSAGGRFTTFAPDSVGAHCDVDQAFGQPAPFNSIALLAEAPIANLAARFIGTVEFRGRVSIDGPLTVDGTITQSIAPGGGGAPIPAFAMQVLDQWVEDFGEQALVGRDARVTLPAAFAAVVDVTSYHVFLAGVGGETPHVVAKDPAGLQCPGPECRQRTEFVLLPACRPAASVGERLGPASPPGSRTARQRTRISPPGQLALD